MPNIYFSKKDRKFIQERAKFRCEYCQILEAYVQQFVSEHIIPMSKDGSSNLENIANACGACNNHKYNKTEGFDIVTKKNFPLFNPRKDSWLDHFSWNEDYRLILGITPVGRVTIEQLQLNRSKLLNLRDLLILGGKHPPKDLL